MSELKDFLSNLSSNLTKQDMPFWDLVVTGPSGKLISEFPDYSSGLSFAIPEGISKHASSSKWCSSRFWHCKANRDNRLLIGR
jgi:hypothetical protein